MSLMPMEEPQWLPFNVEAEQAILGAILINNAAFEAVETILQAEHFNEAIHRLIFENCGLLIRAGKRADPIILKTFLLDHMITEGMSTSQYLARLAANATTIVNAIDYARTIRELADRRAIADVAYALTPNDASDASTLAGNAIAELDSIVAAHSSTGTPALTMREAMVRAVDAAATAYQNEGKIVGVPFCLRDLDRKTHGMSRGDLVILGGRPGMGKTAALLTILRMQAEAGFKCMMTSLEMSDVPLSHRMMSDWLFSGGHNLPYSSLRSGNFAERMFGQIKDAAEALATLPIKIEQQPGLTVSQIAARARQLKRRHGLDVLAVDHLDLVRPSGRYAGNKVYELGEITSSLKALAKELDIVVILLCQLSRDVEKRDDKRPMLADLRSSGSIEQDADTVIFLYRPSYYLDQKEPTPGTPEYVKWEADCANALNKLIAIVAKQRMGPVGSVELFCNISCNAVRGLEAGQ